jgi:amino acid adenylation domain-containing protein
MVKVETQRLRESLPEIETTPPPGADDRKESAELTPIKSWQELFEAQVARTPQGVAVVHGQALLTYGELNQRSNRLAHHLRDLGVGPETLVGLCAVRSLELIVGLVGIIKAGGAYIPLPPDYPPERMAHLIRDSQMPVIVTQQRLEGRLREVGKADTPLLVCVDRESATVSERSGLLSPAPHEGVEGEAHGTTDDNPPLISRPDSLIYVIYTSGSTGEPKGVAVEHHAVARHSAAFARYFCLSPSDRVLQFAPLSFDVSVEEIFPTLSTGGRLVLRPDAAPVSVAEFHSFIMEQQATVLNLPTSYWNEWMKEIERRGLALPPSLRLVIAGSETVTSRQLARWWKIGGKRARWCNAYGTTEAVITSTIYEPAIEAVPSPVPIGRPIAGTEIYLLDNRGQPVPEGEAGELCIGGEKLARGYLHAPAMTAWHFVPDPFSPGIGARLNRTGDYARRLPDGNLEFLGRRDDQVNMRGFRVELAEIEAALAALPEVSEAAVIARGKGAEKRLVAYVVPASEFGQQSPRSLTGSEFRRLLKDKLPAYMIPATYIELDALPRRPNGKVDRHALPEPGSERPELNQTMIRPADEVEEKLSAIWREVLSLDAVGVQDDFFDLGGHSLQAVRLVSAVSGLTGQKLSLRSLYEARTIRRFAERLRQEPSADKTSSLMVIQPQGSKPPLYFVHGAGGGMIWGYANLARHLGPEQPVYAFQSHALDGGEEFASLEEMAAGYVADLRASQPSGPYHLGGYCFGGEVAYEMARQLRAAGQPVDLLVLFNAMPPNSEFEKVRMTPAFLRGFLANSWAWLRHFLDWSSEDKRKFLKQKADWIKRICGRVEHRAEAIDQKIADRIDLPAFAEKRRDLWDIHLRASARYHPKPYEGKVLLFRTQIFPVLCSFDPTFGWKEYVNGRLEVRLISGAHESILDEPHVREVASQMAACLRGQGA